MSHRSSIELTMHAHTLAAVIELAAADCQLTAIQVRRRLGLSRRALERELRRLRSAGILASMRGLTGGYRLARAATEITVADVCAAFAADQDDPVPMTGDETLTGVSFHAIARRALRTVEIAALQPQCSVTIADLVAQLQPEREAA